MKRARSHVGNLQSCYWDKDSCTEEFERYPADHNINYSDLARRFDLKNKMVAKSYILYKYSLLYSSNSSQPPTKQGYFQGK